MPALESVGAENFDWIVEAVAKMAVARALAPPATAGIRSGSKFLRRRSEMDGKAVVAAELEHRHRRGISDRRSRNPRSALAHPGGDRAEGQAAAGRARQAGNAPVGGRDRHRRLPQHSGGARTEIRDDPPADGRPGARATGCAWRPAARTPSPSGADQEIYPDDRYSHHRRGHEDGGARQPDLRPARAHRRGRPRNRHPDHERRALFPAAHSGALRQFAVLAGHGYRLAILPLQGVRQVSAHQHSRSVLEAGRSSRITSTC